MTRQDLCRLLGIDCDTLAAHEAGEERINARFLLRIAKLLEVQPDYFFRGYPEEDRETPQKKARLGYRDLSEREHGGLAATMSGNGETVVLWVEGRRPVSRWPR
jgi:transcriptional regulator with XRE-family HTH domain